MRRVQRGWATRQGGGGAARCQPQQQARAEQQGRFRSPQPGGTPPRGPEVSDLFHAATTGGSGAPSLSLRAGEGGLGRMGHGGSVAAAAGPDDGVPLRRRRCRLVWAGLAGHQPRGRSTGWVPTSRLLAMAVSDGFTAAIWQVTAWWPDELVIKRPGWRRVGIQGRPEIRIVRLKDLMPKWPLGVGPVQSTSLKIMKVNKVFWNFHCFGSLEIVSDGL